MNMEREYAQNETSGSVQFSDVTTVRKTSSICGRARSGLEFSKQIWSTEVSSCDELKPGDIYLFAPNEFVGPLVGRAGLSWFECGRRGDEMICRSAVVRGYGILNQNAVVRISDTSFGS